MGTILEFVPAGTRLTVVQSTPPNARAVPT